MTLRCKSDGQIVDHRFDLPYLVHTNFELGLMLDGKKPLAVFNDWSDHIHPVLARYLRMFDRHVAAGTFVKRKETRAPQSNDDPGSWIVLYAQKNEGWRIEKMIELMRAMHEGRWTREDERLEGVLLGYEDWQNEIWLSRGPHGL